MTAQNKARSAARKAGLKTFRDKACVCGGVTYYTSSGNCVACLIKAVNKRRNASGNPEPKIVTKKHRVASGALQPGDFSHRVAVLATSRIAQGEQQ